MHGLERDCLIVETGQNDDGGVAGVSENRGEAVYPLRIRQREIQEGDVKPSGGQPLRCLPRL